MIREMKNVGLVAAWTLMIALTGCPKSGESDKPAPSASARGAATGTAPPAEAGATAAAGSASNAPTAEKGRASAFGGTYSVAPGKIYISDSKDFSGVKQAKDDPEKHVGEGRLSLTVDAEGRVTGIIDSGPASPAVIDGRLTGTDLRGNVRRKDPTDNGLTGTLDAKMTGDVFEGKLSLAESTAAIVRDGKLSLKKQ